MKWSLGWVFLSLSLSSVASEFHPNRLLVKSQNIELVKSLSSSKSVKHLFKNWYVIRTDNLQRLEQEISSLETVITYERDYRAQKKKLPTPVYTNIPKSDIKSFFNDPKASQVWSFRDANRHGSSISKAYESEFPTANQEIIVAVVDTGIDHNHEDLKEVMWTNPNEIPGNGIDDDQNGYIDDIHGLNTLIRDDSGNATVDTSDTHSHGTHVAGTIGAAQNNGIGIAGIASNVKLLSLIHI